MPEQRKMLSVFLSLLPITYLLTASDMPSMVLNARDTLMKATGFSPQEVYSTVRI